MNQNSLRPFESEPSLSASHKQSSSEDSEVSPVIIKRFSKRLLLISALLGCFIGIFILPYFRGKSTNEHIYPFLYLLPDDIYKGIIEKLPSPLVNAMLYLIADNKGSQPKDEQSLLSSTPGEIAKSAGFSAHHPIFIIPGMTSTGLELWETDEKEYYDSYFRDRFWGTFTMMKFLLFDKKSWLRHLSLDLETGLDPPGIKLRAAQGLGAADFLIPGYWVWGPIIKNLGYIGYDPSNLHMAAYDWRLSISDLEKRDRYFSNLKYSIEASLKNTEIKAVIITHSLDPAWIDKHVHAFVNIAGPLLGVPKTIASLLSGDMKDTVQSGIFESALIESLLSRKERAFLFRRWPGILNLLPKGGDRIWTTNPLLYINRNATFTTEEAIEKLLISSNIIVPPETSKRAEFYHHHSIPWLDPLKAPLPNSPNMTLYSFYGVGKETEIGYHYKINEDIFTNNEDSVLFLEQLSQRDDIQFDDSIFPLIFDSSIDDPLKRISKGVILDDGDGTVPLRSLGLMGSFFWKHNISNLNPHGIKIVTREYLHEPISMFILPGRGGPKTSDHVDILGNHEMTFDILRIVSGNEGGDVGDEEHPSSVSLVKGNISDLAGDIANRDVRKMNYSLGSSLNVLYEHDILQYSQNDILGCQVAGEFSSSTKLKLKRLLKDRNILALQYENTISRLISEAIQLPLISSRYYSNIEDVAKKCFDYCE